MTIISKTDLCDFNFVGKAAENARQFSYYQLGCIQDKIEELYPDGITDTKINELFCNESNTTLQSWVDEYIAEEDLPLLFGSYYTSRKSGTCYRQVPFFLFNS